MSSDSCSKAEETSSPADSFKNEKCHTLWEIASFSTAITTIGQDHFSPSFSPQGNSKYLWFIGLRITKKDDVKEDDDVEEDDDVKEEEDVEEGGEEYIEIFVKPDFLRTEPQCGGCHFNCTLSVENTDLHQIAEWNLDCIVSSEEDRTLHRMKRARVQRDLVNDELLIRADIRFQLLSDINGAENFRRCFSLGSSVSLLNDLSPMLENSNFSDVVISVDDGRTQQNIAAHQIILAARSSFFHAKLTQDTPESRDRCIKIKTHVMTVRNMLAYIYTDQFNSRLNTEQVISLLKCADEYSIPGLKSLCELHLISSIHDANAFKILIAADRFNAKELKMKALSIICQNKQNISRLKEGLFDSTLEMTQEQRLNLHTDILIELSSRLAAI